MPLLGKSVESVEDISYALALALDLYTGQSISMIVKYTNVHTLLHKGSIFHVLIGHLEDGNYHKVK